MTEADMKTGPCSSGEAELASEIAKLRQENDGLRKVIAASNIGLWSYSPQSKSSNCDETSALILGFGPRSEISLTNVFALIHSDDQAAVRQAFDAALDPAGDGAFKILHRIVVPGTDEIRHLAMTGSVDFADGQPVLVTGSLRNITSTVSAAQHIEDLADSQRELALQRDRLEFIKDSWELGTWEYMVGEDGSVWDARCYEMFGVDETPLVPLDKFKNLIHPDEADTFSANVERGLDPEGDGLHAMHFRAYNKKDGTLSWYKTRGRTFFENGKPVRMLGAIQDVSEDMARQDELEALNIRLRDSEKRLKLATEAGQVGTWDYDPTSDIGQFDGVSKFLFQLSSDEPITMDRFMECVHPEDADRFAEGLRAALDPEGSHELDIKFRVHPDCSETLKWASIRARASFGAAKGVRLSGTVQDVTADTKAAEQIALMNRELHHRVKNMFATISGMIRMGARDYPGSDDYAAAILGRVDALSKAHLISMDRDNTAPVQLRQIVDAIVAPYKAMAKVRVEVSGDDPEMPRNTITSIGMILHELATNAVKYGALSQKGEKLEVTIESGMDETSAPVVRLSWRETCPIDLDTIKTKEQGFGSKLVTMSARQIKGQLTRNWTKDGLNISLVIPI